MLEEKISLKYYLFCIGLAVLFNAIQFTQIFIYITKMYVHEFGHAFVAWMSGFIALPLIGLTFVGGEKSFFIFFTVFASAVFFSFRAWREQLYFMCLSLISIAVGSLVLFKSNYETSRSMIIFGGKAAEIICSGWMILACGYKNFKILHMDFFKYFILPIGMVWFMSEAQLWYSVQKDLTLIPYGTASAIDEQGHRDGDMNRLVASGWTEQRISQISFNLVKSVIVAIALQLFFQNFIFPSKTQKGHRRPLQQD